VENSGTRRPFDPLSSIFHLVYYIKALSGHGMDGKLRRYNCDGIELKSALPGKR
jgi:hypothetical protein